MPTKAKILGKDGRIVLPAVIRKEFGLETGERLTVFSRDGEIRIISRKMALEKIRAGIVKRRGSLNGILAAFLKERHRRRPGKQNAPDLEIWR